MILLRHGPTAVLMYGSIAARARDPNFLAVDPERFADHLEHLRHAADVVPLMELGLKSTGPRIVITFDDGYANNATVAEPLLTAAQLPATVFVATDNVDNPRREFWSNRLEHLVLDADPATGLLDVRINGRRVQADVRTPAGRERTCRFIHRALRPFPVPVIEEELVGVGAQLGSDGSTCPDHRMMTQDELQRLAASPLIEVGGHTISHPVLAALSPDEQRHQIGDGRSRLEEMTGCSVSSFAYPFGGRGDFNRTSVAAVREAGYRRACTTRVGLFYPPMSRFRIPRFMVLNWDRREFASQLKRWLEGAR